MNMEDLDREERIGKRRWEREKKKREREKHREREVDRFHYNLNRAWNHMIRQYQHRGNRGHEGTFWRILFPFKVELWNFCFSWIHSLFLISIPIFLLELFSFSLCSRAIHCRVPLLPRKLMSCQTVWFSVTKQKIFSTSS